MRLARDSYSSTECSALGLKDAGEVKDRLNTSPAYRPPPGSAAPSAPRCIRAERAGLPRTSSRSGAASPRPSRCRSPRCNDKPDENRSSAAATSGPPSSLQREDVAHVVERLVAGEALGLVRRPVLLVGA